MRAVTRNSSSDISEGDQSKLEAVVDERSSYVTRLVVDLNVEHKQRLHAIMVNRNQIVSNEVIRDLIDEEFQCKSLSLLENLDHDLY